MTSDQIFWLVLAGAALLVFLVQRRGRISDEDAQKALQEGAVVLDVRREEECLSGRASGAVNIPLTEGLSRAVEEKFPDKSTTILCYCASGARSGNAVSRLKAAGYANARNLGSYRRAKRLTER